MCVPEFTCGVYEAAIVHQVYPRRAYACFAETRGGDFSVSATSAGACRRCSAPHAGGIRYLLPHIIACIRFCLDPRHCWRQARQYGALFCRYQMPRTMSSHDERRGVSKGHAVPRLVAWHVHSFHGAPSPKP